MIILEDCDGLESCTGDTGINGRCLEGGDFLELEEVQSKVLSSSFSSTERDISLLLRSSTTIIRLFLLSKIRPIRIARGSGANHDSLRSYLSERVQMFASCIDSSFLY